MNDKPETKVTGDRDKSVTAKSLGSSSHTMTDVDSEGNGSRMIVVDIGKKQGRKAIKRLRQGRGRLLPKIQAAVKAAVKEVQEETHQTNTLPIVIVVERRPRSRGGFLF